MVDGCHFDLECFAIPMQLRTLYQRVSAMVSTVHYLWMRREDGRYVVIMLTLHAFLFPSSFSARFSPLEGLVCMDFTRRWVVDTGRCNAGGKGGW